MSEAQDARDAYMTAEQRQEVDEIAALLIARPERRALLLSVYPHGAREVLWAVLDLMTGLLDGVVSAEAARRATSMLAELRDVRTAVERGALDVLRAPGGERDG